MTLYSLDGTTPEAGGCWVAPGAAVIGDVTLGEGASIWYQCTVRGGREGRELDAMPTDTPVRIAINIRDPGRDAVNYNILFRPHAP